MANPPDNDNVRFLSAFAGTNGATSLADGEYLGDAAPSFLGTAKIDNTNPPTGISSTSYWPWGSAGNTYLDWFTSTAGGVSFPTLTGASFVNDWYIEFFWNDYGPNPITSDPILSIGSETADEKMMLLYFDSLGTLRFRYSSDGINLSSVSGSGISGASNTLATNPRVTIIQKSGDDIAVYYRENMDAEAIAKCTAFTVSRKLLFTGISLHSSTEPLVFGARKDLTNSTNGAQSWTYIVTGEALYPSNPSSISFPACVANSPRRLTCAPSLVASIPDVTIFNDETVNKDYSYYFGSPEGKTNTYAATNLPTGLSMSSAGVLSGSFTGQTEGSTFSITVTATSSCGSISDTFVITVGTVIADGVDYAFQQSGG